MRVWTGLSLCLAGLFLVAGCRSEAFPFPYGLDLKMSRVDASVPTSDFAVTKAVDLAAPSPDLSSKAGRCRELSVLADILIADNTSCRSDAECLLVKTRCGLAGFCGEYLNTMGRDGLTVIVVEWDQLGCGDAIDCAPCPPQGAPPGCINGVCRARR